AVGTRRAGSDRSAAAEAANRHRQMNLFATPPQRALRTLPQPERTPRRRRADRPPRRLSSPKPVSPPRAQRRRVPANAAFFVRRISSFGSGDLDVVEPNRPGNAAIDRRTFFG